MSEVSVSEDNGKLGGGGVVPDSSQCQATSSR